MLRTRTSYDNKSLYKCSRRPPKKHPKLLLDKLNKILWPPGGHSMRGSRNVPGEICSPRLFLEATGVGQEGGRHEVQPSDHEA